MTRPAFRLAAVLALALAVAGCGGKGSTSAGPTAAVPPSALEVGAPSPGVVTATRKASAVAPTSGAVASNRRGGTPTPAATHVCKGKDVAGVINGRPKCLQAGQDCQSKAASQYPAYGFDCVASGARHVLRKHA